MRLSTPAVSQTSVMGMVLTWRRHAQHVTCCSAGPTWANQLTTRLLSTQSVSHWPRVPSSTRPASTSGPASASSDCSVPHAARAKAKAKAKRIRTPSATAARRPPPGQPASRRGPRRPAATRYGARSHCTRLSRSRLRRLPHRPRPPPAASERSGWSGRLRPQWDATRNTLKSRHVFPAKCHRVTRVTEIRAKHTHSV